MRLTKEEMPKYYWIKGFEGVCFVRESLEYYGFIDDRHEYFFDDKIKIIVNGCHRCYLYKDDIKLNLDHPMTPVDLIHIQTVYNSLNSRKHELDKEKSDLLKYKMKKDEVNVGYITKNIERLEGYIKRDLEKRDKLYKEFVY